MKKAAAEKANGRSDEPDEYLAGVPEPAPQHLKKNSRRVIRAAEPPEATEAHQLSEIHHIQYQGPLPGGLPRFFEDCSFVSPMSLL